MSAKEATKLETSGGPFYATAEAAEAFAAFMEKRAPDFSRFS